MIGYRCLCSVILIALTTASLAVAQPASRNGNVWDNVAHQPNPSAVQADEKARGILASPQEQAKRDEIIDRLAREALERSRR